MSYKCLPVTDPNTQFAYCPSLGAAVLFSILFGLTTLGHVLQAGQYRAGYCWVLIMSAIWQTAAFVVRCISIMNPTNELINNITYCLVLLAPLWTNAFCFMVMARLVHMFMPRHRIAFLKGSYLAALFVALDILAFIVQLWGALLAVNKNADSKRTGRDIYTGGVGLQQFFVCLFIGLTVVFLRQLRTRSTKDAIDGARTLTLTLLGVLFLITIRIIYRIVEFAGGSGNSITKEITQHEAYQYCLDTLPMFFAIVAFHVFHPGRVLQGPDSTFPSRKEKKRQKEEKRMWELQKMGSESDYTSVSLA